MGDYYSGLNRRREEVDRPQHDLGFQHESAKEEPPTSQTQIPFQNQYEYLPQPLRHQPNSPSIPQYSSTAFDMAAMTGALPQSAQTNRLHRAQYDPGAPNVFSPASVYQMHHAAHYQSSRGPQTSLHAVRTQPQAIMAQPYQEGQMQHPMAHRHPGLVLQPPTQYSPMDMYAYGMGASQFSPVDPRFGPQAYAMGGSSPGDMVSRYPPRPSEPVPSFPRGPPRKPKQSGHALWVGNLPPAATVIDLKDHFSRDATRDIESLFLISKSNCAFVNYRTEAACVAAMNRFHDSRFYGVRLVCRLRRGSSASTSSPVVSGSTSVASAAELPDGLGTAAASLDPSGPIIVGQNHAGELTDPVIDAETGSEAAPSGHKVPEKYFVVKSLTAQDLESSVRNGTWATQSHNEQALNDAYEGAENVYLIFSANKSGQYFGYARMKSSISGEPVSLGSSVETEEAKLSGTPQSIPTAATETAPKGRIIDDSARGTIFWEANVTDEELESPTKDGAEDGNEQNWGRQFKIEWISTSRLPFFRTRGLRNPWNANREVKIARDGTELEPSVGRRLVQMFHKPPSAHAGAAMSPTVMPYQ